MTKKIIKKKIGFRLFIFLVVVGAILGGGYYYTFDAKSMESWIKERDEKVVLHLNKAADYFKTSQFKSAEDEFEIAYDLAKIADTESSIRWEERVAKISPPRKFYTGNPSDRSNKGSIYFKNRMIEAIYGYASTVNWEVNNRYAQKISEELIKNSQVYPIPAKEFAGALKAIEKGLEIDQRSEILRVLKAEILTSMKQYNEAISILNEVTSLINTDSAEAYNQLGIIYSQPAFMDADDYEVNREKAIAMFEKASLLPAMEGGRLADPNFNLGMYYSTPAPDRAATAMPSPADARKAINYFEKYLDIAGDEGSGSDRAKEEIARLQPIAL